ncbi:MAG TPA: Maf family protein [Clostridiales bacterium]|nr:MAG: Septum formation protein Maf [Firmicutes bacterium ADurb.Bin262]HOU09384.1 Maf family protein [Clostridiales bacterium]HQH62254.1 Maf family protein [Clostridiales bacterium]HQK72320.1 Maf family protein [Clostridiales bacterium]
MIVLASSSPRRIELLKTAGLDFQVCPAQGEEYLDPALPPGEAAVAVARAKALEIAARFPEDCVIGADTIVVAGGEILGKPKDKAQAAAMLRALSGRTHVVLTGVCLLKGGKEKRFCQSTEVEFYPLTDDEIAAYVDSGEPMDKAGAYGIQGLGCVLVKGIRGDYFNVMGFPVARVVRALRSFGCLA